MMRITQQSESSNPLSRRARVLLIVARVWALGMVCHLGAAGAWALQRRSRSGEDAAACAACGALGGAAILLPVMFFALNIALLVWVARDAKARGLDSAVLWMLLVMFTSIIGLGIYLLARPQGELVQCSHCGNRRLEASARCPNCGNS